MNSESSGIGFIHAKIHYIDELSSANRTDQSPTSEITDNTASSAPIETDSGNTESSDHMHTGSEDD